MRCSYPRPNRVFAGVALWLLMSSSPASAQIIQDIRDHVMTAEATTIHSIFELEYFPNITDSKFGMPLIRFDLNFIDDEGDRDVGVPYYHSTWGNAFGFGGPGIISFEEFITAGISYKVHERLAGSATWEPIGIYVNPLGGVVGSGLTLQLALPLVVVELNERAQGMGIGFMTQNDSNARIRNLKVRLNPTPGVYVSFGRQAIGMTDGPITSFAVGVGF